MLIALGAIAVMLVISNITYRRVAAREEAAVLRRAERARELRAKRGDQGSSEQPGGSA